MVTAQWADNATGKIQRGRSRKRQYQISGYILSKAHLVSTTVF